MDTHKKGFTIIELLVVITIVGMLIAVLLPAMGKAREGARRAQCLSNLRQISMAFYLYLDDHGEQFPPGGGSSNGAMFVSRVWENYLYPAYIDDKNTFICKTPEKVNDYTGETAKQVICNENYYGYNGCLADLYGPRILSGVSTPSTTILCADATSSDIGIYGPSVVFKFFPISIRHSNGANILFVSGNACWFPSEVIDDNTDRGRVGSLPY